MDFLSQPTELPLSTLRSTLIRLEDTIVFALIERAQFKQNLAIYDPKAPEYASFSSSFLEHFLHKIESVHATVRRYESPDEYAFTGPLPEPILPPLVYPKILAPNHVNYTGEIMNRYINEFIPSLCAPGDDRNHGSSATTDIECLQAISRRIHYGKFIAEAKFREDEAGYTRLILAGDTEGIMKSLTVPSVEAALLRRLRRKAEIYGSDITEDGVIQPKNEKGNEKVDPDVVVRLYERFIIPLTKDVEVDYLMQRLGSLPTPQNSS
ncbi:MAG: chorismate mutase [Piptocephalis tieghemiana]|nr:MAG: chorismate mutase [Piptocephalis tieghemiana]